MDLRSTRQRLERELREFGVHEKFEDINEMKQLLAVYHASLCGDDCVIDDGLDQALKESELDFQMHAGAIVNSTMISCFQPDLCTTPRDSPPVSSPDIIPERFTVSAIVHHAMDWSPSKASAHATSVVENKENAVEISRKRIGSLNDTEHKVKRCLVSQQPTDISEIDSGVNLSHNSIEGSEEVTEI